MKALVIYDSAYGNTAKVAVAIAAGLRGRYETELCIVSDATEQLIRSADVLVIGSPTQGGRATVQVQEFMRELPSLKGVSVAAFDTRFAQKGHGPFLRLLMKAIGFAANKIAAGLTAKGGTLAARPEGFIVEDKTGPLKEGELARAREWARQLMVNGMPAPAGYAA